MPKTLPVVFLLIAFTIIVFTIANFSPIKFPLPGTEKLDISHQKKSFPTPYNGPRPETIIISGPNEGETIKDNTMVVFHFVGLWTGDQNIGFETKVDEIDDDWVPVYSNSRIIQLLPGENTYHFYVRAKTKNGIEDETPASRVFYAKISDKAGQIKISSLSFKSNPQKMVLVNRSNNYIDLNNWKIETNYRSFSIPPAVKTFRLRASTLLQNIILSPGDSLIVVGETSPIMVNFYLNRCFGYLSHSYNFGSLFQKDCPRPLESEINYLSLDCQRYINNLPSCPLISNSDLNRFNNDFSCQQFLTNFYNYESCVDRYQDFSDFFKKEWYVFTNISFFDANHDKIILRDSDGLVVDVYLY